jgi:glycosyltransferase involved in cell wall biosynthesis
MNNKKYIYIVQVTRQLSIDILNTFSRQGADIHLITGIVESNYEALDPAIKVTTLNKHNSTSAFKRLFNWGLFTFLSFFYILFSSRKKELILVTTPPFIVFLGLFFKKLRNQDYHLIIWDLYPDVIVNFGVAKESSFVIRKWKKWNVSCFSRAKTLFTLGGHLSKAIESYTVKKPVIIPNWTNTDFLKPLQKNENPFVAQHQLTDKLVVMYSGNMGLTHDIESIVHAAELLKDNNFIHFAVIGDGVKKTKISQLVKEKNLDNVLLLPYQDKAVLPYSLGAADIGVVTLDQGAESISVPSKTYYMLAVGSAILALASKESELGVLVEQHKCGKLFEKANPKEIADYLIYLLNNKAELTKLKENARKASFDYTPQNANVYYKYICGS